MEKPGILKILKKPGKTSSFEQTTKKLEKPGILNNFYMSSSKILI